MDKEERKVVAMREDEAAACAKYYPKCCAYHQGFDAALSLLVESVVNKSFPVYVIGPVVEP